MGLMGHSSTSCRSASRAPTWSPKFYSCTAERMARDASAMRVPAVTAPPTPAHRLKSPVHVQLGAWLSVPAQSTPAAKGPPRTKEGPLMCRSGVYG